MWRTLPVCALLLLPSLAVRAADAPNEMVIRMTVQPMPAPRPAMKYQLLPELREMNPGNPIQGYLKSFMEQGHFYYNKETLDKREKWLEMPLKDLPLQEMQDYKTNSGLRQADWAARLDTPDWQILLQLRRDEGNTLLPDVQKMRSLAGALKVRFRVEVAEKHFDSALVTAKTMLALSRHIGEHPTLIGDLVGISIGTTAFGTVEEMIQQPGCPNLFWALTDLPYPFIDLRKGLLGERMMMRNEFALLDERTPMSEAQLQKAVDIFSLLIKACNIDKNVPDWLNKLARDEIHVRAARKRLIESGLAANKVKEFPALQVILLDEKLEYEVRRDEVMKGMMLPYWQAEPIFRARRQPKGEREDTLLAGLPPACSRVKMAQTRLDQRIALLRCVEALRMYAAEHDGKLPARLQDIKLPLPVDPATGKPFTYQLDGKTAHLHGDPLGIQVRYEVTIGK